MNHLDRLLKKLEELGITPTPEQLSDVTALQAEIDHLYAMIVANQQAFANPLWINDGSEIEITEVCCDACKEEDAGICSNKRGSV